MIRMFECYDIEGCKKIQMIDFSKESESYDPEEEYGCNDCGGRVRVIMITWSESNQDWIAVKNPVFEETCRKAFQNIPPRPDVENYKPNIIEIRKHKLPEGIEIVGQPTGKLWEIFWYLFFATGWFLFILNAVFFD